MTTVRPSRFIAWIAAFAVVLAALMPTLAQAVASAGGGQVKWMELCTVAGMKLVAVQDNGDPASSGSDSQGILKAAHCPYCCSHAGSFALPPSATPLRAAPLATCRQAAFLPVAHKALQRWGIFLSRAPPALS